MFYAHSTRSTNRSDWQLLEEHLQAVAFLAGLFGSKFGARQAASLAGLLHDLGKYSDKFQAYIRGESSEGGDHSTAGAQWLAQMGISGRDKIIADILAYAIAGHHAGLADRSAEIGSLTERLKKPPAVLTEIWRDEIKPDASGLAPREMRFSQDRTICAFQLAFLGRMLFSCLVDADFLDTEAFYAKVSGYSIDRQWPSLQSIIATSVSSFDQHMKSKRRRSSGMGTQNVQNEKLNRLRDEILTHVRSKASLKPGVFTLDVPTGGGKTLVSLAFALDHAREWQMERIIYAIPFTSIIDQIASIFRAILGEDAVLEHHSAIEENKQFKTDDEDDEGKSDKKLHHARENWNAPVVVTTNVQFFESLFANRTSRCRKLHNLAKAVIILDEAQNIPLGLLRPSVAALKELAANYGCTIVLCTATQPALRQDSDKGFAGGFELSEERELAPYPPKLHTELKRVTLRTIGKTSDQELIGGLKETEQGLIIVNSRLHALELYRKAKAAGLEGLIHLTTRQIAVHRREILDDVKHRLKENRPCRLIATSLVEAGVDISFPRVWRAEAGLDQLVQAAGRCNREWEWPVEASIVSMFEPAEARLLPEIKVLSDALKRVAQKHEDLFSHAAIRDYFGEVYWQRGTGLDKHDIAGDFILGPTETNFSYRSVAEKFKLIESGMEPVIVAIDEKPKKSLAALRGGRPPGQVARELQSYIVQVPPKLRAKLIANGHVRFVEGFADQFAELKTESFYSVETGLLFEKADELGFDGII